MILRPRCSRRGSLGICDLPLGHPGECAETVISNFHDRTQRPIDPEETT